MDDCYNNSSELDIKFMASFNNNATEADLPNMATGKAWLCWDENAMYIYLKAVDKTPVKTALTDVSTDGMELFFDFDNINSTDPSPDGRVGNYGANGAMVKTAAYARTVGTPEYEIFWVDNFSDNNDWLSTLSDEENKTVCVITSDGYIIERRIPFNDAVKKMAKPGFTFGAQIDLLDDIDDNSQRDIKIAWGESTDEVDVATWAQSASCDELTLIAAPVSVVAAVPASAETQTAPAETAAPSPAVPVTDISAIPASAPAPKTGDTTVLLSLLSILGASGVFTLKKKR